MNPLFRTPGPIRTAATLWAMRRPWRTRLLRPTPLWSPSVEWSMIGARLMFETSLALDAAARAARERRP